jgi:hypothetical protein
MTTKSSYEVACALCGERSTQTTVNSSNTIWYPDLDTRPAPMLRSTIRHWVQNCAACGYCAPDIGEGLPAYRATVDSDTYRARLAGRDAPRLANYFLCWSMIAAEAGDVSAAARAIMHAAWVCDDQPGEVEIRFRMLLRMLPRALRRRIRSATPESKAAIRCRTLAANRIVAALANNVRLFDPPGKSEQVAADLRRRCGAFAEALELIERGLSGQLDADVRAVLENEKHWILARDTGRHTIEDRG